MKVARQVKPPSLLLTELRVPFSSAMSALAKPLTASLKVKVTSAVSPVFRATSSRLMVTVGARVSTV